MAAALVLTAIFGPVGLCYLSVTTGLIATALATVILVISNAGAAPLLVLWPLSMVWAVIGTNSLRRAVVGGRRHLEGA
ncbi:MAG TPA: hypothetical protein VGX25_02820 [Actinophytocola sp.]|uniref:hypothetical protein n=1 Tax=Actinophytocola sp. TaxID=1872138 RepID=UPI002DDD9C27|nr:hypothetical protein [Actinophytocola sp.]HEV2778310.1 hypothetical protein [Actinophytocola sp.]